MSPVGSHESLAAAIQGGANSVYFGIGHLNMRSKSTSNFTGDDLKEITSRCAEHGVRAYLTLNTVMYDSDMAPLHRTIDMARREGVTAIIASDVAAILYARSVGMEVHLSTQLNISNTEALRFYAQWADVAVLARELTLPHIAAIARNVEAQGIVGPSGRRVKLELFVHGALCMAVSGKCYMSLHNANVSANRGACQQVCRRSYLLTDRETGDELVVDNEYIMSPKDLCTIGFLNKVIDAGVRVLKIEGRARSPEYVKTVTRCYSEAINAILDGSYTAEAIEGWKQMLGRVFNRGFWGGYYLGEPLGEWSHHYGSVATERKAYCGKVTNYFTKLGVVEVKVEAKPLRTGDRLLIIGPTTGVLEQTLGEVRVDDNPTDGVMQGEACSFHTPGLVRRGDKVYIVEVL